MIHSLFNTTRRSLRGAYRLLSGQVSDHRPLGSRTLSKLEVAIAKKALKNLDFTNEEVIAKFHTEFAAYVGGQRAFSFVNARSALGIALRTIGIVEGDEVIVPGYTCIVVPNACEFEGATVVYADIELDTYGLDFEQLKSKITDKTKCVVLQHLFGMVARDYEICIEYCRERGIAVIEDCAHTLGATFKGSPVGSFCDFAFYSFEQSKVLSTYSGGVLIVNGDRFVHTADQLYANAKYPDVEFSTSLLHGVILGYRMNQSMLRPILIPWLQFIYSAKVKPTVSELELQSEKPFNYGTRMISPLAEIAMSQLARIEDIIEIRNKRTRDCEKWSRSFGYKLPMIIPDSFPVFIRYPIMVEENERLTANWSKEFGDTVGVWFTTPTHPVQREVVDCPNGWEASRRMINLPTY